MTSSNMSIIIPPSQFFPDVEQASEDGLLAFGGEVSPNMILDALVHGIFPWPIEISGNDDSEDFDDVVEPMEDCDFFPDDIACEVEEDVLERTCLDSQEYPFLNDSSKFIKEAEWGGKRPWDLESLEQSDSVLGWWTPDPRAIFDLDSIHVPRRLQRKMNSGKFRITFDQAFPEVMIACALAGNRESEGTWITQEFFTGYCKLFELGFAHSVECWLETNDSYENSQDVAARYGQRLVGGVYGVAINGFFDGESMFSSVTDASKIALFSLLLQLKAKGFRLFDLQILNSHTKSLGGIEISRKEYLKRLNEALRTPVAF